MNSTWKIYLLAFMSFYVSTSEYVIAGILDQIAAWANISISAAGQLITVFAIAGAIGSPIFVMATTKMDQRHLLMLALAIVVLGSVLTVTLPGFGFLIVSRIVLAIEAAYLSSPRRPSRRNWRRQASKPGRSAP